MILLTSSIYTLKKLKNRKANDLQEWSKRVRQRDDYTCDICSKRSKKNHAHHLYSKEHYPKKMLLISNGITLCSKCHRDFHSWNGGTQEKCTKADYERYKNLSAYTTARRLQIAIVIITLLLILAKGIYAIKGELLHLYDTAKFLHEKHNNR